MFRKSYLKSTHKFLDIGCGIGSIVLQAAAWAGCQAAVGFERNSLFFFIKYQISTLNAFRFFSHMWEVELVLFVIIIFPVLHGILKWPETLS